MPENPRLLSSHGNLTVIRVRLMPDEEAVIKVKAEQSNALPFALVANFRFAYGALGAGAAGAAPGACISFCSSNSALR